MKAEIETGNTCNMACTEEDLTIDGRVTDVSTHL